MADKMIVERTTSPELTAEQPLVVYQRLASILLIGIFVIMLTCICSCTLIAMTFLINVNW